ncbi:outer membrane protein [Acidocella sp.]|uniref:outer membrane protein n=1 Tax=Acidocella sp. TaxID=50710 RepID=UPI0026047A1F|nr:outer membrane beta-barrel protein [Acidocella sp.]
MRFCLRLTAAMMLAAPVAARAQAVSGPYVSLGLGGVNSEAFGYHYNAGLASFPVPGGLGRAKTPNVDGKIVTRPAAGGSLGVGFGFGNGVSLELDAVAQRATAHGQDGAGQKLAMTGGVNSYGFMVNTLYTLPLNLPVSPYVGGGAGYQWTALNSDLRSQSSGIYVSGTKASFAYDLIAGLAYAVPMVPGLAVTAEYRFTQLTGTRYYRLGSVYPLVSNQMRLGQMATQQIAFGLRYQFSR